jgi:hypothetical protein
MLNLVDWSKLKCRFGCDAAVVGIYHAPQGCVCWPDPVQALCAQHAIKADQNVNEFEPLVLRTASDDEPTE